MTRNIQRNMTLGALLLAVTLTLGCADDSEQQTPVGPSPMNAPGTLTGAAPPTTADPSGNSRNNGTQTTATVTAVVLRPGHGTGDFEVSGELPPGMSRSQLEQGWEKRILDGMRQLNSNPPPPPSRVRELNWTVSTTNSRYTVRFNWRAPSPAPTGNYIFDIERPYGNVVRTVIDINLPTSSG